MELGNLRRYRRLIRPNRSLSRRTLLWALASYLATEVGIGVAFLLKGAWPVLPFAGLEIIVIGIVLHVMSRHARDYELVVVDDLYLKIVRRQGKQKTQHRFQRYWAKVSLSRDTQKWYPSRLVVGSHGRFVEIGTWMDEDGRQALAHDLQQIIQR